MKKKILMSSGILFSVCILGAALYGLFYFNLLPKKEYTAEDFGIQTVKSGIDRDGDGIDDYTDIMLGARSYLQTRPKYKNTCYTGGYPPDGEGVCTDVIWKAFENAGYSLKDMVDQDVAANTDAYPGVNGRPDTDIDFRRVRNLLVFFKRHAASLTLDLKDIQEWQPGDIVVLPAHIGIISDKRNKDGVPYLLHNGGQPVLEEDVLERYEIIEGHFRWEQK